jgi:hypothetical protein
MPTQPPVQLVTALISPGLERPGHEANHASPSGSEVKNEWSYTATPPLRLHGVRRNNFTFTEKRCVDKEWEGIVTVCSQCYRTAFVWREWLKRNTKDIGQDSRPVGQNTKHDMLNSTARWHVNVDNGYRGHSKRYDICSRQNISSSRLLFETTKIKTHGTVLPVFFCVGVKLGLSCSAKSTRWGFSKIGFWVSH